MDLIPQYLANRRKELDALDSAIAQGDFDLIQSIGHKLKGNAGSYGFDALTTLGDSFEQAGKNRDLDSAKNCLVQYSQYLDNVYVLPA
jgi:HPt (histidine-containing phosphotransfer) domain-containing protein